MKLGLVLGAGGVRGVAFIAGALMALEHDHSWDARDADIIVGTSAGAIVGTLLRAGLSSADIAALVVDAPPSAEGPDPAPLSRTPLPPIGVRDFLRIPNHPSAVTLRRWATQPWSISPTNVLASLVADGRVDLRKQLPAFDEYLPNWPDRRLWLCAARRESLERVVFGRNALASVGDAVAASCAVPGYFCPVTVGKHSYVDGGVHSPTNLDLLHDEEIDAVLVIAPMSGRSRRRVGLEQAMRTLANRRLTSELQGLRARAVPTLVLEPTGDVCKYLGLDFVAAAHVKPVLREAFLAAGANLHTPAATTSWPRLGC